jgi:hypothetical protein
MPSPGRYLPSMSISLFDTRDTSFKGAVGEMVAQKYLWNRHIVAIPLGAIYPPYLPRFPRPSRNGLTAEQVRYLKRNWEHGPRRWDFWGYTRGFHNQASYYVVEVKTTSRIRRDSVQTDEQILRAKRLHFRPLLLNVRLEDNWTFHVSCLEL